MWRKHVIELDGTRLWIPSAYFPDDRKNVPEWFRKDLPTGMTDIGASYTWKEPKWYYEQVRNDRRWMFMMESGSASLPPVESLSRFIPQFGHDSRGGVYPHNKIWAHRGANSYYRDYDLHKPLFFISVEACRDLPQSKAQGPLPTNSQSSSDDGSQIRPGPAAEGSSALALSMWRRLNREPYARKLYLRSARSRTRQSEQM